RAPLAVQPRKKKGRWRGAAAVVGLQTALPWQGYGRGAFATGTSEIGKLAPASQFPQAIRRLTRSPGLPTFGFSPTTPVSAVAVVTALRKPAATMIARIQSRIVRSLPPDARQVSLSMQSSSSRPPGVFCEAQRGTRLGDVKILRNTRPRLPRVPED